MPTPSSPPALAHPASRVIRTWHMDSRRWDQYVPRPDDIVVATYPKCGTTWTQQIVSLLIFQSPEPRPVSAMAPWIDARFRVPVEEIWARLDAQPHRRSLKSHLPLDALPMYDHVRYIHVARDGLDACMSWHNHATRYKRNDMLDATGLADETIGRAYPRVDADPRQWFLDWMGVSGPEKESDVSAAAFFDTERSYWQRRHAPNLLLVHYAKLLADLDGEMRRMAAFLGIAVDARVWPSLVEAASFAAMKRDGGAILPGMDQAFEGGHNGFINAGRNERWRDVLTPADIALYRQRAATTLDTNLAHWLETGEFR